MIPALGKDAYRECMAASTEKPPNPKASAIIGGQKSKIRYNTKYTDTKDLYKLIRQPDIFQLPVEKNMLKNFLCVCCLISLPLALFPNDTAGTILPTGGVVFEKQDGIKMQTEALYIRPGQIEVNYLFGNTTDKDITTQIFFPLPDMPAVEEYLGDEAHDFKFELWVNGKPKTYQTHWAVIQNNQDITSDVSILFYRSEEVITDQDQSSPLIGKWY